MALALFAASVAHAELVGNWAVNVSNDGEFVNVAAVNDSGNLLGQYCYTKEDSCVWLLGMNAACKEGDEYAVLANSDIGAAHISVYCSKRLANGLYRYIFTEFNVVDNIVKEGLRVGFAVPLQTDNFRVLRFDLGSASRALDLLKSAYSIALQKNRPAKSSATRDQDI